MSELALHKQTREGLHEVVAHPPHALLLVGAGGSGKMSLAAILAAELLDAGPAKVLEMPAVKVISATK